MTPHLQAIGVDIGGTNMRAARISASGEILEKKAISGSRDRETAMALIMSLIRDLDSPKVAAIGIGVPGRVDSITGEVLSGGFLDLSGSNIRQVIASEFGRPVAIANDCSMALIAENEIGAARGLASAVMLTIGTGIGGAAIENGKIVNGKQSAGQLGHLIVNCNGRTCVCGQRGCVETESSGTALRRHIAEAGYAPEIGIGDILDLARSGDRLAIGVIIAWASPLRAAIGTLSAAFDPGVVVLGGGLGLAAVEALGFVPEQRGWYKTDIRAAQLGDDAGVIGAGLAALMPLPQKSTRGKRVLMVNGVPASGKSSVSHAVSERTGWPVLALDTIKNPFLAHIEGVDRLFNRTLGKASYQAIFAIIRDAPQGSTFIVDAWFGFQPLDLLRDHIAVSGIEKTAEIWCHAPGETLAERYGGRLAERLPGHPGEAYISELIELAKRAEPTHVGAVLDVDTTQPPHYDDVAEWAAGELGE
jgi:glucokinase